MNERIRKLAIKSGIDIRGHLTGDLTLDEKPSVFDLEKFAELIVRECVNMLTEESERLSALAVREKNQYCFDNLSASAVKCEDMAMFFEEHFGLENERTN
jgi:hypothetical protein